MNGMNGELSALKFQSSELTEIGRKRRSPIEVEYIEGKMDGGRFNRLE